MKDHMSQPVAIFCCAASKDADLLREWETHLLPLQQAGRITFWSELQLAAGSNRQEHILQHFAQAKIIVLLLSASFFASNACMDLMTRALQRKQNNQIVLLPLLLRSSAWEDTVLGELSCLPHNKRPVTLWNNRDEAFQDCLAGIRRLINQPAASVQTDKPPQDTLSPLRNPSLSTAYHSCFLSHAHQDEPLASRLLTDLQSQGVKCWSASHNMKIGAKIRPTIDEAIERQDKLLLLLSEHALTSAWIEDEVEAALEYERRQQREMLFPILLDDSVTHTTQAWAAKIRRTRHIGDFTRWADPLIYQQALDRLLRDLKKEGA